MGQLIDGARCVDGRRELSRLFNAELSADEAQAAGCAPATNPVSRSVPACDIQPAVPPELELAIDQIRRRMPDGKWQPSESAEFLKSFSQMLDQRSYQLAKRLCQHPRDAKFWLTLPRGLAKIVFRPRR